MAYKLKHILDISFQSETLKTSFMVALVVGIILNLINQGDAIIALNLEDINIAKFIITFFVPFGVSIYSTVSAKLAFRIGDESAVGANIECARCSSEQIAITKGEQIPTCSNCQLNTDWKLTI